MKVSLSSYSNSIFRNHEKSDQPDHKKVQLVLGFGAKQTLASENIYGELRYLYPAADIVLCSTSGEIFHDQVMDDTVSVTAIEFDKTLIKTTVVSVNDYTDSYKAGVALVEQLEITEDLKYIMIISDGEKVNGSKLVNGINQLIQHRVPVTGGLAGDGTDFISTLVGLNEEPASGKIVAIAFYGQHLSVSHASMGGWEIFGPERTVTKSEANRLYEINGQPALDLYKQYLGSYAEELPRSALLFPLSMKIGVEDEPLVRTILSIDHESKSMVFAGDIPEGARVRFMKSNFDKLINAANGAANKAFQQKTTGESRFTLLISCVGRKMILNNRVQEEVEAVHEVFGKKNLISGFYAYGEISPFSPNTNCELHNQTMTITSFNEY
jgi:hypothetical protein